MSPPLADPRRVDARWLGIRAEQFVVDRMQAEGWSVLARNLVAAGGEVDVVARLGGRLRFVEVKARVHPMVDPLESITAGKRRRVAAAAERFLDGLDVAHTEAALAVAVVDCTTEPWSILWIDDAWDG